MSRIILASSSPRRKELLEKEGISFVVDASLVDEVIDESLPIKQRLIKISYDKACPIHQKYPHDIVIGADTVVYSDHCIIGKPRDRQDAKRILKSLSGKLHIVYTAVTIFVQDESYSFVDETKVYFRYLTESDLENYLDSMEWQGKAGGYAIQGKASDFVWKINGDIDTVIGLPVKRVVSFLQEKNIL